MNFLNLLPELASAIGGMGSPEGAGMEGGGAQLPDMMSGINESLARNRQLGQQQQMQRPPGTPSKFLNALGMIGDVLATWRGGQPLYQERLQQQQALARQQQTAQNLANYLGVDDPGLAAVIQSDPGTGLELWKMKHPTQEPFTLGEGQARFDQTGREIAHGPEKLDTVEIDGVVFNKRTGEPLFESPYSKIVPGSEGSFYEQPRMGLGRRGGGQGDIRAQAEEAIRMGADPAEVNRRLQQMLGGATASPSNPFPGR
jgi:hypothetical protein